jgi:transcriptional regulator with XRE-family HTH domain|tara:strand:- start:113 stop:502 length:390 start_codon:yes stop_codon:yes gene_type:complete
MDGNFNRHLGSKLRMRRLAMGLTQSKVAQAINVTFQQIQKYEKGTNGISSLRLMQLASFLKVSVMYFFDDYSPLPQQNIAGKQDRTSNDTLIEDLNYSFLAKLFSGLSVQQKEKIFQVLKNTKILDKTG